MAVDRPRRALVRALARLPVGFGTRADPAQPNPAPAGCLRPPARGAGRRVRCTRCQPHRDRPFPGPRGRRTPRIYPRAEGRRGPALRRVRDRHHALRAPPPVLGRQQLRRHLRRARLRRAVWFHRRGGGPVSGPLPGAPRRTGAGVGRCGHSNRVAGSLQRLPLLGVALGAARLQPLHPDQRGVPRARRAGSPPRGGGGRPGGGRPPRPGPRAWRPIRARPCRPAGPPPHPTPAWDP